MGHASREWPVPAEPWQGALGIARSTLIFLVVTFVPNGVAPYGCNGPRARVGLPGPVDPGGNCGFWETLAQRTSEKGTGAC